MIAQKMEPKYSIRIGIKLKNKITAPTSGHHWHISNTTMESTFPFPLRSLDFYYKAHAPQVNKLGLQTGC